MAKVWLPGRLAAYFLAFFLLGLAQWLGASFDSPSIDQILYHLHYSDGMGIDIGRIFLFTFAMECLAFPLAFACCMAWHCPRYPGRARPCGGRCASHCRRWPCAWAPPR